MSTGFELTAVSRTDLGKGATRRLRKENKVPAVVYGAGSEPVSITLGHNELLHSTENEAFFSHILSLEIDGKKENVVIKDLQRHPSRAILMHADFLRINLNEKLKVHVPIHFIGEDVAPGVKLGGVVTHDLVDVEVECLPKNLPEFIEVDISELELGESIHLSNLTAPKGTELVALIHGDLQVVSIQANRAALLEDEEEAPAADAADSSDEESE